MGRERRRNDSDHRCWMTSADIRDGVEGDGTTVSKKKTIKPNQQEGILNRSLIRVEVEIEGRWMRMRIDGWPLAVWPLQTV